ncbi:hypothetical protein PENFLA_c001G03622 [Penicillium flavigenum]|uniref:Uncharacterized protein n=1 Tax=Penicillium flavigenum TaxID=254877 RepID=A0A1V6U210_9EURO|nr:hypothetical protein PENFLA_c001G03622 [Penicillium flavigenum]
MSVKIQPRQMEGNGIQSSSGVSGSSATVSTNLGASTTTDTSAEFTSSTSSLFQNPIGNVASRTASSSAIPFRTPTNSAAPLGSSHGDFNSGTLAGATVGAFAGGCILALLAAVLFFRSRKKTGENVEKGGDFGSIEATANKISKQSISTFAGRSSTANPNTPAATTFISKLLDLSPYIPQPADDSAICVRVQTLFDQAGLHVENYYSRTASNPPLSADAVARISCYDSRSLPASFVTMLSKPQSQRAVLTHALVQSLLRAIQPGTAAGSLLPACYAQSPKQWESEIMNIDTERAGFAWRMLTSFLCTSNNQLPTTPENGIINFAEDFTRVFEPYSNPQFAEADRVQHLASISKSAADLGIWLFSQPCSFMFRWTTSGGSGDKVVVLPAIVKVCDEQGRRLAVPETLVEEKIV